MTERITLNDTVLDIVMKMTEGNPGAITVLGRLQREHAQIDPQNMMGWLGVVLSLDSYSIYGSRIWMLYKDVCKEDLVNMVSIMRAVQMGLMSEKYLNDYIDNNPDGVHLPTVLEAVREKLSEFAR